MSVHIREYTEDDRDAVFRLRRIAFNGTEPSGPLLKPGTHGLVAEIDGRVAGVLGIGSYAQFYGGAAVPMGGIGGVAVDGAYRGRGVANALLDAALVAMREHGQPISALYPTVPTLYRGRGWEHAASSSGSSCRWTGCSRFPGQPSGYLRARPMRAISRRCTSATWRWRGRSTAWPTAARRGSTSPRCWSWTW